MMNDDVDFKYIDMDMVCLFPQFDNLIFQLWIVGQAYNNVYDEDQNGHYRV